MDFRFSEDQQDLIEAATVVFDGENTLEHMRALVKGEPVSGLWPQLAELGLLGFMAPESLGGLDQNLAVMAAVAEAAAYVGVSEPFVETAGIVIPSLIEAGIDREVITAVLSGKRRISLVSDLNPYSASIAEADYVLTGSELSPVRSIQSVPVKSIDPLRTLFKVSLDGAPDPHQNKRGAVLTAAELIGLSRRMVQMSVDYAKDRHQFGKPIGSFQAIKHQLANVHTQIEFTRPIILLAALKGGVAVHNAKVAAIDTAMLAAETAIQVHGGMGYTFEVDLHLFMKRAWALCGLWGDRNYHMRKLENAILDGEVLLGPGYTFTRQSGDPHE